VSAGSPDRETFVLGINAAYHESAAALFRNGNLVCAVEEERWTRIKHAKPARVFNPDALPWQAIDWCLRTAGIELADCSAIAYSHRPDQRRKTLGRDPYPVDSSQGFGTAAGEAEFERRVRSLPDRVARAAGIPELATRVQWIDHHAAHAASAFYCCPFSDAALLVIDGIGEASTAWLGIGTGQGLVQVDAIPYPHSLGLLWERFAVYLGFTEYDACKVMGLSAFGDRNRFAREFDRLVHVARGSDGPALEVDATLARFRSGDVDGLESLFGPRRQSGEPYEGRYADVAAGLQRVTEQAVLTLAARLHAATDQRRLAYAGGVALNCVANAVLEREGPFEEIYILGAAHDAGTAIGAAALAASAAHPDVWQQARPGGVSLLLGPSVKDQDPTWERLLPQGEQTVRSTEELGASESLTAAVQSLTQGAIVAWMTGRAEFGPRALGARSLLADPRSLNLRERLNATVKHREAFRPFGASILEEYAAEWFDLPQDRPGAACSRDQMILAYPVRPGFRARIPGVIHQDGTCRIQTVSRNRQPRFHELLTRFHAATGVPLLLNTSFNDQEPLVATVQQGLATFARTDIDLLIVDERVVARPKTHGWTVPQVAPPIEQRFPVTQDSYGMRLALVFGNHAPEGRCPFEVADLCHHCDIGRGEGAAFDLPTNRERWRWYRNQYRDLWSELAHLVIYNSGSVLNPRELPPALLDDILNFASQCPSLRVISLDSRESFVTAARIESLVRAMRQDQSVRVILGLESSNEHLRNGLLQKRMPWDAVRRALQTVKSVGDRCGVERVGVDVNLLVGGPGTTLDTAVAETVQSARDVLAEITGRVDFNLHPYYPSARGRAQFPNHGRCPESVVEAARVAIEALSHARAPRPQIFIGRHEEGHATDAGSSDSPV